jgi:hypothetical protein
MLVTRTSLVSGVERTLDLAVTEEQMYLWQSGAVLLQDAFPGISKDDREFIKTGIIDEEWETCFKEM